MGIQIEGPPLYKAAPGQLAQAPTPSVPTRAPVQPTLAQAQPNCPSHR